MESITVKSNFSNMTRNVTLLTSVEDVNDYIDLEIESSEIREIVNERGVNKSSGTDTIEALMSMYKRLGREIDGVYDKALMSRIDILEMKRKNMIECVEKYDQVWVNPNGTYSTPIRDYIIVKK